MTSKKTQNGPRIARRIGAALIVAFVIALFLLLISLSPAFAQDYVLQQQDIAGPVGSENFGSQVTFLPNGNFVVTDPLFDASGVQDVGAVFLYDGDTLALISALTGVSEFDHVGSGPSIFSIDDDFTEELGSQGITVLTNGNFVVTSSLWNGERGAVTLVNGETGLNGVVTESNSLVGTHAFDQIGGAGIRALPNGNYVIGSPNWDNGAAVDAGAITFGNGTTGITGPVSASCCRLGLRCQLPRWRESWGSVDLFAKHVRTLHRRLSLVQRRFEQPSLG